MHGCKNVGLALEKDGDKFGKLMLVDDALASGLRGTTRYWVSNLLMRHLPERWP